MGVSRVTVVGVPIGKTKKEKKMSDSKTLAQKLDQLTPKNLTTNIIDMLRPIRPHEIVVDSSSEIVIAERHLQERLKYFCNFLYWVHGYKNYDPEKQYSISFSIKTGDRPESWYIQFTGHYSGVITPSEISALPTYLKTDIGKGVMARPKIDDVGVSMLIELEQEVITALLPVATFYHTQKKQEHGLLDDLIGLAKRIKELENPRNQTYLDDDIKMAIALLERH